MQRLDDWGSEFERFLQSRPSATDPAHDIEHVRRVVANAMHLAGKEGADRAVVYPAAWLHDCVFVAKDSPQRAEASRLAARAAVAFLSEARYPIEHLDAIAHAIAAHSFSAGISPLTTEARRSILQRSAAGRSRLYARPFLYEAVELGWLHANEGRQGGSRQTHGVHGRLDGCSRGTSVRHQPH